MSAQRDIVLGIDVGGTFTDVLAVDRRHGAVVGAFKLPSTPTDPAVGAIEGVDRYLRSALPVPSAVFHGTTVGTNTLIEKKGGPTALVTTAGFRDVLVLRRQARPRLYDLVPRVCPPLVERERRFEVAERLRADGRVQRALEAHEVARIVAEVGASGVASVAVCLLHAYANDEHEQRLADAIADAFPALFVTASSQVCREFREFERTSTTVVNAYIGPSVSHYVSRLGAELARREIPALAVVKSNGGLTSAENAARYPAQLIESGPAAGVIACANLGRAQGFANLIAFDLGGTTAKVGVVRGGQPRLTNEFDADRFVDGVDQGGYPIKSPVIDIIEIGAGGGSIARLDASGVIEVGPRSAGAQPGPACYARGGEDATVTDAHVCLGHIAAEGFGSDDVSIDPDLARWAIRQRIADPLGWEVTRAAAGIVRLATAKMAEMVRLATLRRGIDPREFVLVAFGGGGALHAGEIAREVGIAEVVVPPYPGLFSAIGTVLGDVRHDLVQTVARLAPELDAEALASGFGALRERADVLVSSEDVRAGWHFAPYADLRYEGQLFELTLPLEEQPRLCGNDLDHTFRSAYREHYGYDLADHAVEVVNLRLVAQAPMGARVWPSFEIRREGGQAPIGTRETYDEMGRAREVGVIARAALQPGQVLDGPLIIEDLGATIRVLDGQAVTVRGSGILVINEVGGVTER